jgi:hypothetical protein
LEVKPQSVGIIKSFMDNFVVGVIRLLTFRQACTMRVTEN